MIKEHELIKSSDGYSFKLWHMYNDNQDDTKGTIIIVHGMAEHYDRYLHFIEFIINNGYDVYTYNHRGHGSDVADEDLGFFAENEGWSQVVSDCVLAIKHVKKQINTSKLFVFAHSMGSLVARNAIQQYDEIDGLILSGTSNPNKLLPMAAKFIAKIIKSIKGSKHRSQFLDNVAFGSYNKMFKPSRTKFDWLTSDNKIVAQYIEDKYCGYLCTTSFFVDLSTGLLNITNKKLISKTRKNLPIFIISGDKDPVGDYGKGINNLVNTFKQINFTDINSKLYPEMRHEILNEVNKDIVYKDVIDWINDKTLV